MTTYVAAKPAKPAKPSKPGAAKPKTEHARKSGKAAPKGGTHASAKHDVAKKGKKAQPDAHQKHVLHMEHEAHLRGYALSAGSLPVCAVEAVAMSLRVLGQRVSDEEVVWLWELAGGRELTIPQALATAARFGLAGCVPALDEQVFADFADDLATLDPGRRFNEQPVGRDAAQLKPLVDLVVDRPFAHALILGVSVPGPHCVLATADGWWSWGRLYQPWTRRVDEAVAVSWS